jgi:hypothetical protein
MQIWTGKHGRSGHMPPAKGLPSQSWPLCLRPRKRGPEPPLQPQFRVSCPHQNTLDSHGSRRVHARELLWEHRRRSVSFLCFVCFIRPLRLGRVPHILTRSCLILSSVSDRHTHTHTNTHTHIHTHTHTHTYTKFLFYQTIKRERLDLTRTCCCMYFFGGGAVHTPLWPIPTQLDQDYLWARYPIRFYVSSYTCLSWYTHIYVRIHA